MAEKATPAAKFTRVVSRSTSFVDRITRDTVEFALVDDGNALELRVNKAFAKRVAVLRIHPSTAQFFDQDDWLIAAPHHQFVRLEEKLRALAGHAAIPAFTIISTVEDVASYEHNAVTCGFTSATLSMPRGTGTLQVSWSRPAGTSVEVLEVWPAASARAEGAVVLATSIYHSWNAAGRLVQDTAVWISSRASSVFVVIDAACVEGQVLVNDALPKLHAISHAAILLVPAAASLVAGACDTPVTTTLYSGAAAGYSAALTLHKLFSVAVGHRALALVDADAWPKSKQTILPVLRELLPAAAAGGPPICFPRAALASARAFLSQVRDAYSDSRPYVHAFIGAGALEADVSEAVEAAARALAEFRDQPASAVQLERLEPTLLGKGGRSAVPFAQSSERAGQGPALLTLVPIGHQAVQLADLLHKQAHTRWHVQSAPGASKAKAQQSLIVLDMADGAVDAWLQQAVTEAAGETTSEQGEGSTSCLHILALLPESRAPHSAWDTAVTPLAELMGGDTLELGLALAASVGSAGAAIGELLEFLEALASASSASASFHDIAFQLRPGPRVVLGLPARLVASASELAADPALMTLTGTKVAHGEVSASFSLWPSRPRAISVACDSADIEGGLLGRQFLRTQHATELMRAGVCYHSHLATDEDTPGMLSEAQTWHICACETAEALLYRRAAGDFEGRANGAFQWQGGEDGPRARLWELAAELDGDAATQGAASNPAEALEEEEEEDQEQDRLDAAKTPNQAETPGGYSDDESFDAASEEADEEEKEEPKS